MTTEQLPFEVAFERLEKILQRMNAADASLDESLKLYEEADGLIASCSKRLAAAETKIETLVKNREGQVVEDGDGHPTTENFS